MSLPQEESYQQAWVIFTGKTDIFWLKLLKPGFRHCFILLNDGKVWMSLDSLSSYTDIQVYHHLDKNFDLPQWLQEQNYQVVSYPMDQNINKAAPWMFFTCVEAAKRVLGVHNRFIFTPWQLYRHLTKTKNNLSHNMKGKFLWA